MGCFLELGPDAVLSAMTLECLAGEQGSERARQERAGGGSGGVGVVLWVVGLWRCRCCGRGVGRLVRCWVRWLRCGCGGVDVDWGGVFAGLGREACGVADVCVSA